MNEAQIFPLFSKPVYFNKINYDIKKIYPELKKIKWVKTHLDQGVEFTSSSTNKFILNKKPYKQLKINIEQHFNNYVSNLLEFDQRFKISTSWLTKSLKNEICMYHNHNNCMYSGVLYLKTPKNKATISFENVETKRFKLIPRKYNLFNYSEFFINTVPGDIVIFPSEVFHKINTNTTNEKRISLAFNFIPIGKIGSKDSYLNINMEEKNVVQKK